MQKSSLGVLFVGAVLLSTSCAVPSARKAQPRDSTVKTTDVASLKPVDIASPSVLAELPTDVQPDPPSPIPVADQPAVDHALKTVRVLLADNQSSAKIEHSGRVYVYTQNLDKTYKVSSAGTLAVRFAGNGRIQVGSLKSAKPIIIEPAKETLLTWNDNLYAGKIVVVPAQHTFILVEHVDLENYLYGVLPYEMSYSWPPEALKAQAVAARTYTLRTLENVKNQHFDLYSDVRSQMYKGGGKQYPSVKQAVDATKSKVLTYNDKLFYTYYHGNCGGGTDDVKSWNHGAKTIKPLSGASCAYDKHSKSYSFKQDIPYAKVSRFVHNAGLAGSVKSVGVAHRTSTGRATQLVVHTNKGHKNFSCNKFRLATGLRSCKLTKLQLSGNTLHTAGHGYGHGIGMCQDGANGMAKAGKTYEQILANYYPGSKLTTLKK